LWEVSAGISTRGVVACHMFLTQSRLIFQPNRLSPKSAVRRAVPLDSIVTVERIDRTGTLYDGGLHSRIRLVLAGAEAPLVVVVHDVDKTLEFLSRVLENRGA
jgi:hypothetical protein